MRTKISGDMRSLSIITTHASKDPTMWVHCSLIPTAPFV